MREYHLKLGEFEGPLDKLLELIEARKLEVTRLSLAEVTADFLKYLESLERAEPQLLADFIAVAAKLILIKSHALLPQLELSSEEEAEIADLERRLKFYQEFRPVERHLKKRWRRQPAFGRPYLVGLPPGFYLDERLEPKELEKEMARLISLLAAMRPAIEAEKFELIKLEDKIKELLARVSQTLETSFEQIVRGRERQEIIVLFLALLHLLKDNIIKVSQSGLFSEIKILTVQDE
jgi:segregation and condensation protein A